MFKRLPLDSAGGSAPKPPFRLALRALAMVPPPGKSWIRHWVHAPTIRTVLIWICCYRDSTDSELDSRRPVKLRELRRRSDQSRFQPRPPFARPPFFRPPMMSPRGPPFRPPPPPSSAVPGRPGPARLMRPAGPGGPRPGPGRGPMAPVHRPPPALRQPGARMMLRPRAPGQVRPLSNLFTSPHHRSTKNSKLLSMTE